MFGKKDKKILRIEGMSCNHCSKRVEDSLLSLKGIKKVKVNLENKEAIITLEHLIDDVQIKEKIEDLGFKLLEIKDKKI